MIGRKNPFRVPLNMSLPKSYGLEIQTDWEQVKRANDTETEVTEIYSILRSSLLTRNL